MLLAHLMFGVDCCMPPIKLHNSYGCLLIHLFFRLKGLLYAHFWRIVTCCRPLLLVPWSCWCGHPWLIVASIVHSFWPNSSPPVSWLNFVWSSVVLWASLAPSILHLEEVCLLGTLSVHLKLVFSLSCGCDRYGGWIDFANNDAGSRVWWWLWLGGGKLLAMVGEVSLWS